MLEGMKYLVLTLVLIGACASGSPAASNAVEGVYADINSNRGDGYATNCSSALNCSLQAVRLLEQYAGVDRIGGFTCTANDAAGARCHDRDERWHAYVRDCTETGERAWDCTFGVSGYMVEDADLGTVKMSPASYRFEFDDGSLGIGDPAEHSFDLR